MSYVRERMDVLYYKLTYTGININSNTCSIKGSDHIYKSTNQVFLDCVTKNKIQHPIIIVAITPNIACVFHPLCTNAAFRLYFFTVVTYSENPLARHARLIHQNTMPKGRAIRRSS